MRRFSGALLAAALATAVGAPLGASLARAQDGLGDVIKESVAAVTSAQAAAQPATPADATAASQSGPPVGSAPAQTPVVASNCPGNPDALGTSRVLAVDPAKLPRVGRMQYPDSLPLEDHEVVLTFDDGPLPPYSNQILDTLASQCVKVTYFLVGEMARAYPQVVRRMYEEGHTIGTHSEHHPMHFGSMPVERIRLEIDAGISDVGAALGDPKYLAPFFRFPGLDRSNLAESELAARSVTVFSSDTVADDWHHGIKPDQIMSLALSRLEARGRGILLLHDIHQKTADALPGLLKELKDKGFRIVQVVPAPSYVIAAAQKPDSRMLASATPEQLTIGHGIDDSSTQPSWPETTASLTAGDAVLPVPDPAALEPDSGVADDTGAVQWPEQLAIAPSYTPRASGGRVAGHEVSEVTGSISHGSVSAGRRHVETRSQTRTHARAGANGSHADLSSRPKTVAALSTPPEPAY
jgi:peptidoglycan/xylan/chitin deacetylase (PgdA/CDA1 family)